MIETLTKVVVRLVPVTNSTTTTTTTTQSQNIGGVIGQMAQEFTSFMTTVLGTIDSTVIVLARLAYISVLLMGVLLYYTHLERRLGRDLIKGGIVLAILSEFVFPLIGKI